MLDGTITIQFTPSMLNAEKDVVQVNVVDVLVTEDNFDTGEKHPPGGVGHILQVHLQEHFFNQQAQREKIQ